MNAEDTGEESTDIEIGLWLAVETSVKSSGNSSKIG